MTVRVHGIRKAFGGAIALAGVDLQLEAGEIHALLGPNGAGKTTLIRCLSGGIEPDAGEIWFGGQVHRSLTPRGAFELGVATIYQTLSLISSLTVAENIFLGSELRMGPFVRRFEQRRHAAQLLGQLGVAVDPGAKVANLPMADRQVVEIAKAFHRTRVQLLVLDEPTSALTQTEARRLAAQLRSLKEQGVHILYITHLLREVFDIADRVTVLRDGRVILSAPVKQVTQGDLVGAITGEVAGTPERESHDELAPARVPPLLEINALTGPRFGPISFALHGGEILSIFGLVGSGRTELLETIFGRRRPAQGSVLVAGKSLGAGSPAEAIRRGLGLVPADRLRQGIMLPLSTRDNLLLPSFRSFSRFGFRRKALERRAFESAAGRLRLHPTRDDLPARALSGGNQQKLVVGRWLESRQGISLLMLDEPTQGIDIGTRQQLYDLMRKFVRDGQRAILFTSGDPEEVCVVADRALVLEAGQVTAELNRAELSVDQLFALAHGGSTVSARGVTAPRNAGPITE